MDDRFCSLTVTADRLNADALCSLLESHNIPVMVEHLMVSDADLSAMGFRILAPAHKAGEALALIKQHRNGREIRQQAA